MSVLRVRPRRFPFTLPRIFILCIGTALELAGTPTRGTAAGASDAQPVERISINDNRTPAGTLDHGTLTVHLEARAGEWHPDGESDLSVVVNAFAVEGGHLQIPAPILRVVEGTEIRAWVRNRLDSETLVLHGLYSRPAKSAEKDETISMGPGEVRDIHFVAGSPGTYFYWAEPAAGVAQRGDRDSQLAGAIIIDPRGGTPQQDRVFVITAWADSLTVGTEKVTVGRMVINGKSWPHTERLAYDVGDTVRMHVVNVSGAVHPMHLHGFYFNVDSRGDERADTIFPAGSSSHLVNTERLSSGRTFSLTWIPTRPGNWLFHCHDSAHIVRPRLLDGRPAPTPTNDHAVNHALEMMGGPIIGITVHPAKSATTPSEPSERRRLRLTARVDSSGTQTEPAYGFSLEEGSKKTPLGPPHLPGPTIVLKRGEPVSITVENQLPEATAVHWHGIELENSYYDGVAGFAGSPDRIAPAIAPGGSFEARFTPTRAGTFIYHSHVDEMRQLRAGLSGALLVLDSPASYDPTRDIVLLVSVPRRAADNNVVLLNGTSTPAPIEMHAGERYRLRFINIHIFRPSMRMRMLHDNALTTWRALAKDGMDLPADQAIAGPSEVQMGNGETYDFEFVATTAGENLIDVRSAPGDLLVSMPVHVR